MNIAHQKDISQILQKIKKDDKQNLSSHKLSTSDYDEIVKILGREPNLIELGIFSAMWSEHCSYKSSKKYLRNFPTKAPWVVQGPGENAGVISIGKDKNGKEVCAVFKMESHNHPSFIEPNAGAATGVGGIMRDIFTMGARPVASLDSIRFGDISSSSKATSTLHKYLVNGVSEGIGGYGNCMGVPTIGGETSFESCYNGNILVNAFTLGICNKDEIFYAKAEGVGNPVIYVGSKTGKDGLGGAVMSSDSFNEDSKSLRPTVQVGDPFSEKLLLEACLELFKSDLIVGIQDMGAAGLTSSSFEMAGKSGAGMRLDLDKVPMRENSMNPYELMLSESQERMLICAKKGCEKEVIKIFEKWEVDVSVIGCVTDTGIMELYWDNELCAKIPIEPLSESAPLLDREVASPKYLNDIKSGGDRLNSDLSLQEIYEKMLNSIDFSDKSYIYSQYDSTVQTNSIVKSGDSDASVIRIKQNGVGLSMSVFCNPRYCYLDPKVGSEIAVAISGRKSATRGAMPLAITDCLNFGSPENPEVMWQFKQSTDGIKNACEILQTPVVSGNVSLHNRSEIDGKMVEIYPTPSIASVGVIQDASNTLNSALKQSGDCIIILGIIKDEFGGSLAQKIIEGKIYGTLPQIDLQNERKLWELLVESNKRKILRSAKSVDHGGVAMALTKMAILGGYGVDIEMSGQKLFSESQSVAIVESDAPNEVLNLAKTYNIQAQVIGKVGQKGGAINIGDVNISLKVASDIYYNSFKKIMES